MDKQYGAILIDPPWKFNTWNSHLWRSAAEAGRNPESHYPTMHIDDIKALPMQNVMADNCAVFMWICWPTMPEALELAAAWGLTYKTCAFLWAKTTQRPKGQIVDLFKDSNWHMGMGYWTRANTEPCLLFVKGSPKRKAKNVRQLVVDVVRRHSQKPDGIYGRVESLVDGPYCELFARQTRVGWDSWGNEVESTVPLQVERLATSVKSEYPGDYEIPGWGVQHSLFDVKG